jgi:enolase
LIGRFATFNLLYGDRVSGIARVLAREVLDSRGSPTVEVEIFTAGGACGRAIVPAGASTGKAEARELRDGDSNRYDGRGVHTAVQNVVTVLGPAVAGMDVADQAGIDTRLCEVDGTADKARLGANAILGVSMASAHAAAATKQIPLYRHIHEIWKQVYPAAASARLPAPMTNMISGGLHAGGNLDFQDFLVQPIGAANYATALEWLVRIARRLSTVLIEHGYEGRLLADEGGFGPRLRGPREALDYLIEAIQRASLLPGRDVTIALDVASTQFWDGTAYRLTGDSVRLVSSSQMVALLESLVSQYPITSIEDGLAEDDWYGWQELTQRLGQRVRLVGDDLLTTNPERLQRAIELSAANAILIKLNQIGTLTETLQTMRIAKTAGWDCIVSARSGETEDTTIADLAVATSAESIKIGCIHHGERLAKYNQLLRIAEQLEG